MLELDDPLSVQSMSNLKDSKKVDLDKSRSQKSEMELRFTSSEGAANSSKSNLAKFLSIENAYTQCSVNVLSFTKAKKKKPDNYMLAQLNQRIDQFFKEIDYDTNKFIEKAVTAYRTMEHKDKEISAKVLNLLDQLNLKTAELKKLASNLEDLKQTIPWDSSLQEMDSLTASFFEMEQMDNVAVQSHSLAQNYSAILALKMFTQRIQDQMLSLIRRICSQVKKSRMMMQETEELEYFLENINQMVNESVKIEESAVGSSNRASNIEILQGMWTDVSLITAADAEKHITFDFVVKALSVMIVDLD